MATFEPSPDLDPKIAQAIQDAMDALRAELLGRLDPQAKPVPLGDSGGDRLSRLEQAVGAIDSATSQTELLTRFLEEAGAFADRSLFLVRDGDDLNGWAAFGFSAGAEDVAQVSVSCPEGVAAGQPQEDATVADAVCDQLAAVPATESLLIPFALRGSVAGALYVDRNSTDSSLDRPALRILSYVAAQAVETLPLRRSDADAPEAAAAVAEPVEQQAPAEEPADEPGADLATAPAVESSLEAAEMVETEDVLETSESPIDQVTDPEVEVDVERMIEEVEPETTGEREAGDIVAIRRGVAPAGFETVEDVDRVEAEEEPEAIEVDDDEFDTGTYDTVVEEVEDQESAEAAGEGEPEIAATVESEVERAAETAEVQPPERAVDDAEVAPPEDLDGPGWAFSGSESISEDSRHEEARRLARLLVTEIKLYNEEKVREGRENNDIYDQLRDDIERSRRIYEERIDDEVRQDADYFQEEVVRILAGGDSTALGA